jgi:hypothetical protein
MDDMVSGRFIIEHHCAGFNRAVKDENGAASPCSDGGAGEKEIPAACAAGQEVRRFACAPPGCFGVWRFATLQLKKPPQLAPQG